MDKSYYFSSWIWNSQPNPLETDEATSTDPIPITPVVVEANSRYPHILDVKMQTKHLSTSKIVDLVWAKPSSHGNEWNKYTTKDFISDSEDLDRISIKPKIPMFQRSSSESLLISSTARGWQELRFLRSSLFRILLFAESSDRLRNEEISI